MRISSARLFVDDAVDYGLLAPLPRRGAAGCRHGGAVRGYVRRFLARLPKTTGKAGGVRAAGNAVQQRGRDTQQRGDHA